MSIVLDGTTGLAGAATGALNGTLGAATPSTVVATTGTFSGLIAANGGGITFPATQVASANANTLDDYEEGTWTPVIGGADGATGQTYTVQNGRYTKIGNLVTIEFNVALSNQGTMTGGSGLYLRGLPFSAASVSNDYIGGGIISGADGLGANLISMWLSPVSSGTVAYVGGSGAGATTLARALQRATYVTNTTNMNGSLTYRTT